MRLACGLALVIAAVWLGAARADGPRMLLASSWTKLPTQEELDRCPLDPTLNIPRTGLFVQMTCDVDGNGALRSCRPDERADARLQRYALCVSEFFEARPGISGAVIVPIGVAPPERR